MAEDHNDVTGEKKVGNLLREAQGVGLKVRRLKEKELSIEKQEKIYLRREATKKRRDEYRRNLRERKVKYYSGWTPLDQI